MVVLTRTSSEGVLYGGVGGASAVLYERLAVAARVLARAGYGIQLVGHSLGAGTAALVAVPLREKSKLDNVQAVCFAPPPVVSAQVATKCAKYCVSILNGHDVIKYAPPPALLDLQRQLFGMDWGEIVRKE